MLEYFVHLDLNDPPDDLILATAQIPDNLTRVEVTASQLPAQWRHTPAPPELAGIGDEFVQRGQAAILIVPSALAPSESNWLINPLHPGFSRVKRLGELISGECTSDGRYRSISAGARASPSEWMTCLAPGVSCPPAIALL